MNLSGLDQWQQGKISPYGPPNRAPKPFIACDGVSIIDTRASSPSMIGCWNYVARYDRFNRRWIYVDLDPSPDFFTSLYDLIAMGQVGGWFCGTRILPVRISRSPPSIHDLTIHAIEVKGPPGENDNAFAEVFALSTSGAPVKTIGFNDSDGAYPDAGVIQATSGVLYGTNFDGGTDSKGNLAFGNV